MLLCLIVAQEEIEIQEALNEELRAKLQSEAQDREMIPLRQRNYQFNEEDSFIVENDPGFQYYDDTEITDPPSHYPSQPLIVSTLTRTVQYETVGFASSPAMPTQMMRASNSPVKIPWYKRSRVRTSSEPATFQTGLQLLTAQEQRVAEL